MTAAKKRTRRWLRSLTKVFLALLLLATVATTWIIQTSGDSEFQYQLDKNVINDITGLNPIRVKRVLVPESIDQIVAAIQNSSGPISIGGGRYSQGGQTAYADSLHIDTRHFDKVVNLDVAAKEITVQPGITWREIQDHIDPHDLSVRIMQTYANFTVGGSLSVNVHGRYIGEGPVVESVKAIKLVLADGSLVVASPEVNSELFYGAIGGYGGLGVIVEARLSLVDNQKIERIVTPMPIGEYKKHFFADIRNKPEVVFHNADIYPPDYEKVRDVSWYKTDKTLTIEDRLIARDAEYNWQPWAAKFVAGSNIGKRVREHVIDPLYYAFDRVVWRNWEASYDVRELEPSNRDDTTYALREYFIPVENFDRFVTKMRDIFQRYNANIINVSVRHAHQDPGTLLAWARGEMFAFVVYYRQGTNAAAREAVKTWSQGMIAAAISENGSYYLPYQIFATAEQFLTAYPRSPEFFSLKRRVDPDYRFRNQLWQQYYPVAPENNDRKVKMQGYQRGEEQTFLTIPEWYLVFNPLEYAEFLEAGKNPSNFPFLASIDEYWKLYDRVRVICRGVYANNSEYITMLRVIGISTTVEYLFKGLYENSIGRFTRWLSGGEDTQEDKIIQQAHRAYSTLIFDKAWYEFNFWSWVQRIWSEPDFFGKNIIRKLERKLAFSLEYGFKTVYAKLIAIGAKTAYEESEGLIYLQAKVPLAALNHLPDTVKMIDSSQGDQLLSVPRWGEFTKAIPVLADLGVAFNNISGNERIALSFIAPVGQNQPITATRPLFYSNLVSDPTRQRLYLLAQVGDLSAILREAQEQGFHLEHIYDY